MAAFEAELKPFCMLPPKCEVSSEYMRWCDWVPLLLPALAKFFCGLLFLDWESYWRSCGTIWTVLLAGRTIEPPFVP